jgi:hypothetical protein
MRGPRALSHPTADRNPQLDSGAPKARSNLDPATDILCAFPHAAQTMPSVILDDIESSAIVHDVEIQPPVFDLEGDTDFVSAGMPQHIVHSFFEDEKDLTPQVRSHLQVLLYGRRLEFKADVSRRKDIASEAPHAMREIA